jgi:hypothetical protein
MGLVNFTPEEATSGSVPMNYGIHKRCYLTSIEYEFINTRGEEYIKYNFAKKCENDIEESYTFRQKWTNVNLKFAANVLLHIASNSLHLNERYENLELKLKLKEPTLVKDEYVYRIKNENVDFNGNIIFAILNLVNDIESIAHILEYMRNSKPVKYCALKLSQMLYMNKPRIGFNQIKMPFIDKDPEGGRLRFNEAVDVEMPSITKGLEFNNSLPSLNVSSITVEEEPSQKVENNISEDDLPF